MVGGGPEARPATEGWLSWAFACGSPVFDGVVFAARLHQRRKGGSLRFLRHQLHAQTAASSGRTVGRGSLYVPRLP